MKYAQIKNGIVQNIIVLEDVSLKFLFGTEAGFDALVKIEQISPLPQIGWNYDSDTQSFSVSQGDG